MQATTGKDWHVNCQVKFKLPCKEPSSSHQCPVDYGNDWLTEYTLHKDDWLTYILNIPSSLFPSSGKLLLTGLDPSTAYQARLRTRNKVSSEKKKVITQGIWSYRTVGTTIVKSSILPPLVQVAFLLQLTMKEYYFLLINRHFLYACSFHKVFS